MAEAKPGDTRGFRRILRVRTLQHNLARVEEARARDRLASETALRERIARLADDVAPRAALEGAGAFRAAAHYRERLHQSAAAAEGRERQAAERAEIATEHAREAFRGQTAVEKLIARREAAAAIAEMRKLSESAPVRQVRHDPC